MEKPNIINKTFHGVKIAFGVFISLPFIMLMVPLWFVYRWHEVRSGRPKPAPPWTGVTLPALFSRSKAASPSRLIIIPTEGGHGDDLATGGGSAFSVGGIHGVQSQATSSREQAGPYSAQGIVTHTIPPSPGGVALVTGGTSQLGVLICQDLVRLGYQLAITYHHSRTAAETVLSRLQEQGGVVHAFALDQSDPTSISALLSGVETKLGVPTLLINNASLFVPTDLERSTWEELEWLCRVNLQGPLWLAMRVGQRMKEQAALTNQGGQIIQVGDVWGERPLAGYAAYSVTKAGLLMATRALAREMAPTIRVNAIAPGAILPGVGATDNARLQQMLAKTPLAKQASPEAVLQAIRYLLTAQFVTGEILHVDGGRGLV